VQYHDVYSGTVARKESFCIEVFVQAPMDFLINAFDEQMISTVNYGWFEIVEAMGPVPERQPGAPI
jgi:hypothetical protein